MSYFRTGTGSRGLRVSSSSGVGEITYPCWLVCSQDGRAVRYRVRSEMQLRELVQACHEVRPPIRIHGVRVDGIVRPLLS